MALVGLVGCGPKPHVVEPPKDDLPMHLVIARVNANNRMMDFLLRAGGVSATVKYVDEGGPASLELSGILLYRKPRDLYLGLKHTLDVTPVMEIGSNDEQFWVWKRQKERRYWWGEHERMGDVVEASIPVRPDHLLEVLGLEDLPTETTGPDGPLFWIGSSRYELIFLDRDDTGQSYITRTIDIDRREPFLVRSIVHFRPDGHPVMSAKLFRYEVIQGSEVLAPRKIEIKWLERQSQVKLEFLTMRRFDKGAAEAYFVSPLQRGEKDLGLKTRVDQSPPTSLPAAALPATQPDAVMER